MVHLKDFWSTYLWATILIALAVVIIIVVIAWYCVRRRRRRGYVELTGSSAVDTYLLENAYQQRSAAKETAVLSCQYHLRAHPEYDFHSQLPSIGSRVKRTWFLVSKHRINKLLLLSEKSKSCRFTFDPTIEKTIQSLLQVVDHPYVLPIDHVGFIQNKDLVVCIQPIGKGSLKDLLYNSQPLFDWETKYSRRRNGLSAAKTMLLSRQILAGLDYLKTLGIPHHNIHSGNVIMVNDIPKITGYENYLFGHKARQRKVIDPYLKQFPKEKQHIDIINVMLFGHLLYEMATGVEIDFARPPMEDITRNCPPAVASVLAFIFYNPETRIPTLLEVQSHSAYSKYQLHELKEMQQYSPKKYTPSASVKKLLAAIAKRKQIRGMSSPKKKQKAAEFNRQAFSSFSSYHANPSFLLADGSSPSTPNTPNTPNAALSTATASTSFSSAPLAQPINEPSHPAPKEKMPPPPPPQTQPQPQAQPRPSSSSNGRGALLSSIQQGTMLRKTKTNDRSGPRV